MTNINNYLNNVSPNEFIECELYSYNNNEVIYDGFYNNKHIFVGFNDIHYNIEITNDNKIKKVTYNCPNISIDLIPQNNSDFDLVDKYNKINISSNLYDFQNSIKTSMFVSLYKKINGQLVLTKDKKILDQNRWLFNYYCLTLPLCKNNFITYRAEYRLFTDDMINLIYNINEINYDYPFSTTYNLEFALDWVASNILFVIYVPFDCNYMLLKNNDAQYEITLQQGKLNIINKYKIYHKYKYHYVFYCDFIPSFQH